ncbi:MAG: low molecular weight phosphotyrosine protein phosphatase [Proteobacteria bacterium]|jgi:protein-tyrosine phosphatase|nr:low molecular weight phosphotyrosine protein phosphatase [Pseudomonadota bacterium]
MGSTTPINVLFVCMGNICRSPTAEGVFRHRVREENLAHLIATDSAGTHAYHVGEPPDPRAQSTAERRGIELADLRARRVVAQDFEVFHYVLAMDRDNYELLSELCPTGYEERLHMIMDFAPELKIPEVPDPYYGGANGFERVFDMIEAAAHGLLEDIRKRHLD